MKSIYDFDSEKDEYNCFIGFVKALAIVIGLVCVVIGVLRYFFVRSLQSWDDANLVYSMNSKESWDIFTSCVDSSRKTIKNVRAEGHSNLRQRDYIITFDTDSATLLKLIRKKGLVREKHYEEKLEGI